MSYKLTATMKADHPNNKIGVRIVREYEFTSPHEALFFYSEMDRIGIKVEPTTDTNYYWQGSEAMADLLLFASNK